jgi:hypothetical protein
LRVKHLISPSIAVLALAGPSAALAAGGGVSPSSAKAAPTITADTGGAGVGPPPAPLSTPAQPIVDGAVAKIINGVAYAPSWAPLAVQRAIWAGNQIRHKPYIWGGGHQSFRSRGYDCSGSVSYVLHAAGLLSTPDDSSGFYSWGAKGVGQWITVYTNPGHAFIEIAGIRLDTSSEGQSRPLAGTASGSGPRWRQLLQDTSGFQPRYVVGY